MSLRRKIALWLYPELKQLPARVFHTTIGGNVGPGSGGGLIHASPAAAHVASYPEMAKAVASLHPPKDDGDSIWKAEVLEQLKAISQAVNSAAESGRAMSIDAIAATHIGSGVFSGQTSSQASC